MIVTSVVDNLWISHDFNSESALFDVDRKAGLYTGLCSAQNAHARHFCTSKNNFVDNHNKTEICHDFIFDLYLAVYNEP